ncbi:hypothetical protein ACGFX4_17185 [Kitasatospora sp. NPDC048365]|uniref:hypothetical protein n=1 Tax=Kitasatospora sp. NPDC048365 TaxID=3364050 RepID=UPI0037108A0F
MIGQLQIVVQPSGGDLEFLEQEVQALHEDLLLLDIPGVEHAEGPPAPEGARAGAADLLNVLLVSLPSASPLLENVVGVVKEWLGRTTESRKVVLEIDGNRLELGGVPVEEQRRLTDAWLAACAVAPQEPRP